MKLVIFDLLGVVINNKAGGSEHNISVLYNSLSGPKISFDEFYSKYKKYIVGMISKPEFWAESTNNPDLSEKLYLDTYTINPEINRIVTDLEAKYKIIAVSNHPAEWIDFIAEKFQMSQWFERIYVSGKVKLKKPQKALFQKVLDDYSISGEDCVLVDDQNKNLIGAAKLGIRTIHLNVHRDPIDFNSDLEVKSLDELSYIEISKVFS